MTTVFSGRRCLDLGFNIDETNLRVRAEQLRTRMSMYPALIVSQLILQPLFVWLFWAHSSHTLLSLWLVGCYALHAVELGKWVLHRAELNTPEECRAWHIHFTFFSLAAGLLWGSAAAMFFPTDIGYQSLLICVMLGLVAGAVTMNPVHPPALFGYSFGIMIPLTVRVSFENDTVHWILVLMLILFTGLVVLAGNGLSNTFILSIRQRFENYALLQQLMAQKAQTDEARNQLQKTNVVLSETLQELQTVNVSLEQRVREQTRQNIEKEQLLIQQSRSAAMGEMIGNIAHQWRQPLSTLGLVVQNIQLDFRENRLNQDELTQYVDTAEKCVTSMSETIDDFRNFFRPDKALLPFNLHQAIAESLRLLEATLRNHNIRVSLNADQTLQAYGQVNQFSQVILNLLANAKDALVTNNVHQGRIEIDLSSAGQTGMLVIRDNAGGIPEDVMVKIFDPYFTTKASGTGIGLYMSKTIIEKHMGGSISCRNTDEGAEFTVSVPLMQPAKQGGRMKGALL